MGLSRREEKSGRVAPVREFFEHVASARTLWNALVAAGRLGDLLQLARGHFARGIERRLEQMLAFAGRTETERSALAHAQAGAMLSLLEWWLDHGSKQTAAEMDQLFHQTIRTELRAR